MIGDLLAFILFVLFLGSPAETAFRNCRSETLAELSSQLNTQIAGVLGFQVGGKVEFG